MAKRRKKEEEAPPVLPSQDLPDWVKVAISGEQGDAQEEVVDWVNRVGQLMKSLPEIPKMEAALWDQVKEKLPEMAPYIPGDTRIFFTLGFFYIGKIQGIVNGRIRLFPCYLVADGGDENEVQRAPRHGIRMREPSNLALDAVVSDHAWLADEVPIRANNT